MDGNLYLIIFFEIIMKFQVIISDEDGDKLISLAKKQGRSMSNLIRKFISDKLEQEEKDAR